MKKLLLLLTFAAFAISISAQVTIYEDDFESYTVGQGIAAQSPWWIIWPNMPDAPVVTEQANSGTKSLKFIGTNDVILILNKSAGKYQVDFWYYVPSGFAGYFNFQRLPTPGVEWVCEVYFANNGTGFVHAGGQNAATFSYPQNQWFYVKNIIDLDGDQAELHINNNLIHTYQWSLTSQGATSPHGSVLGGLNLFSGAPTGQTPSFYCDDVSFIELESGTLPEISVNPDEFDIEINSGQLITEALTVSNIGDAYLTYNIEVNYVFANAKRGNGPIAPITPIVPNTLKSITPGLIGSASSVNIPSEPMLPETQVTLNYDGPNEGRSIGLNSPNEWEVAARFPNSMTLPYAGMELKQVAIYIAHTDNCSFKLRVYGEGTDYAPGALLHEQVINAPFPDWYTITLTDPITITGEDLWVGYWINQTLASIYPAGCDEGPAHPEGDYIKVGAGWGHLSDNPSLNYNWNIRAILEGDAVLQWLSVAPDEGTVEPAGDEVHDVNFNASGLALGEYEAVIKIKSNDPENSMVTIPVFMDVTGTAEPPVIGVDPTSFNEELLAGDAITRELTISNTGQSALNFSVEVAFPVKKSTVIHQPVPQGEPVMLDLELARSMQSISGGQPESDGSKNNVIIHYDGANEDAIGLSVGGLLYVAARFPASMMSQYAGYTLEEVDVFINDVPQNPTLRIWGAGSSTAPGALLYEQGFVPFYQSWYTITLNQPVVLTGNDIWIGYSMTHAQGQFPAGCDGGPANTNGSFISTDGNIFSKLFEISDINVNWNIRGLLMPEPTYWLSVNPTSGLVPANANVVLDVHFDASDLEVGTHAAEILIHSNDPVNQLVTIPVTLIVQGVGINDMKPVSVMLYPVPAANTLSVNIDGALEAMQIFNLMGQLTSEVSLQGLSKTTVDVSGCSPGIYFVKFIQTDGSSFTRKIVIGQ